MHQPVTEEELHAYVDGLLPPDRRAEVAAWLQQNPAAAARVHDYQRLNQELRAAYPPVHRHSPDRPPRKRWHRLAQAASWLGLALLGGVAGWELRGVSATPPPTSFTVEQQLLAPALVSHRVYTPEVLHPVEVRRDQQQHLIGWLSKRLGHRVNAPDLEAQGFSLMGGRLLPSGDGPAAQFMYENSASQRLTLYVRQAPQQETQTTFRRFSAEGLSSFYWIDGELGYALTGEVSPEALMASANRVYQQLGF